MSPNGSILLENEVLPLNPLVISNGKMFVAIFQASEQILVEVVVRSVVTEMPIKLCLSARTPSADTWHHDVATISRIARNGERPGVGGLR